MGKYRKSNVFVRYLWCYTLIAIAACLSIGIYFFVTSLTALKEVQQKALLEKLDIALRDMAAQDEAMERVALEISITQDFSPSAWKGQETRQMKLLELFKEYSARFMLSDQYSLSYQDSDLVFLSSGKKTYRYVYAQQLGIRLEELNALFDERRTLSPVLLADGAVCMRYPIRTSGYTRINGMLVCRIEAADFRERIQLTTGGLAEPIHLSVDGIDVLGKEMPDELRAEYGRFSLSVRPSFVQEPYTGAALRNAYLALIVAFVIALAAFFAYWTYKPLYLLGRKYALSEEMDELKGLDSMMTSLLSRNEAIARGANERLGRLKPQMLSMLLHGNREAYLTDTLKMLGVALDKNGFSLFLLSPLRNALPLAGLIEDMTDEQLALYAVPCEEEGCMAVMACLDESYLADDAMDLIRSLTDSAGTAVCLRGSGWAAGLEELSERFEAMTARPNGGFRRETFQKILDCVRRREWNEAQEQVSRLSQAVAEEGERAFVLESAAELVRTGREEGFLLDEVLICDMMLADTCAGFAALIQRQIEKWIVSDQERAEFRSSAIAGEVIEYIHAHYMDYGLSLDSIAAAFGVSSNTLQRVIKRETRMTYREYVVKLRIDVAKRLLLRKDRTVTEVAAQVGYANLSHFIKSFRMLTGVTPASYRDGASAQPEDKRSEEV